MRLYGGAQFHRAMAEFRVGVSAMACPTVTREEIINACGMVSKSTTAIGVLCVSALPVVQILCVPMCFLQPTERSLRQNWMHRLRLNAAAV